MRLIPTGAILCTLVNGAHASDRAAQLVNSFQVMCMIEPLNFERSEERATAMKLPVMQDTRSPPDASGYFVRVKSWLLPLTSGPHEFAVSEAHGPKADVKTCGISAPDVDAEDFKSELVSTMKLGQPESEGLSDDGQSRDTVWAAGDLSLTLTDGSPRNVKQGIYLLLSNRPSR